MEQQFDLPQLQTDPETFRRVWSRVMPDQENSPLVVVSQPQPAPAQSRAESAPGTPPPAPAPDRPRPPQTGAQACTEAPLCLGEEARPHAQELQQLPPVAVYEPTYVERPPEVDTSGQVDIQQFDDTWVVEAPWLQQLIASVNFGDFESRNWFDQKLRQSGLFDKLEEMGIQDGDIVSLYDLEFEYQR